MAVVAAATPPARAGPWRCTGAGRVCGPVIDEHHATEQHCDVEDRSDRLHALSELANDSPHPCHLRDLEQLQGGEAERVVRAAARRASRRRVGVVAQRTRQSLHPPRTRRRRKALWAMELRWSSPHSDRSAAGSAQHGEARHENQLREAHTRAARAGTRRGEGARGTHAAAGNLDEPKDGVTRKRPDGVDAEPGGEVMRADALLVEDEAGVVDECSVEVDGDLKHAERRGAACGLEGLHGRGCAVCAEGAVRCAQS
jgi:hypothetical protein